MSTNLGLKNNNEVVKILEVILASESILNLKIRKYHRNVKSMKFKELHIHFEGLYNESYTRIDEIAERIRILGSLTIGTYKEYLEKSFLEEDSEMMSSPEKMIERLVYDKEKMIIKIRESIEKCGEYGDVGTEDFLTGILTAQEKDIWMLESMK